MMRNKLLGKPRASGSGATLLRDELNSSTSGFLDDGGMFTENKGQMMENFEEWIKLATDNKINSKNSWNFALIDYFHDLNVIKDGDNINFQKASATLDGCVKIYSSRVDSVATETGKLLSGLAAKRSNHKDNESDSENENAANADDNADLQEEGSNRKRKKRNRVLDSTLVEFSVIKIKKLDQELAIDPLFKKALAEFDEGGAKSLLLNTLDIDQNGRVVFDATSKQIKSEGNEMDKIKMSQDNDIEIPNVKNETDVVDLRAFLYNDPVELESKTICPSMSQLQLVLKDIHKAKNVLDNVNQNHSFDDDQNEKIPESVPEDFDYDIGFDFGGADDDDDDENHLGPLDNAAADIIYNDSMAQSIADNDIYQMDVENGAIGSTNVVDKDLMAYFDQTMKRHWRGPEHWRVQALRKKGAVTESTSSQDPSQTSAKSKTRKTEEEFSINFMDDDDKDVDVLFLMPKKTATINLKPSQLESENHNNLLPDDHQFNSERLINFFLKPTKAIALFAKNMNSSSSDIADENFFAQNYEEKKEESPADFFDQPQDDFDGGDMDFDDNFGSGDLDKLPAEETEAGEAKNEFGSQLITGGRKMRPEYVNFSRIAKKVDVKVLKDNLWKTIKRPRQEQAEGKESKNFGTVVKNIGRLYSIEEKKDLSTSFCFICLLHLANEHSLSIEQNVNLDDLTITGF